MTSCFKCGAHPPSDMIYCLECGARLDGEHETVSTRLDREQETFIVNMTPGMPTFVGYLPIAPSKRRSRVPITSIAVLLTVLAASIYIREGRMVPVAAVPEITTAMDESVQRREAVDDVPQTKVKLPLPLPPTPKATPEQTAKPIPKRPTIAMATKSQPMRTRIEIVDGIDRCYAIPGGRRIPC